MDELQREKEKLSDPNVVRTAMDVAYTALCTPIRSLPVDILREIALHSVDGYPKLCTYKSVAQIICLEVCCTKLGTFLDDAVSQGEFHRLRPPDATCSSRQYLVFSCIVFSSQYVPICRLQDKFEERRSLQFQYIPKSIFLKALGRWAPRVKRLGIGGQKWINLMASFVDRLGSQLFGAVGHSWTTLPWVPG